MRGIKKSAGGATALWLLFMTIIAAPMIGPERAYACSCASFPDAVSAMNVNAAVFAGEVTKVEAESANKQVKSSADKVEVTFTVQKVWKGSLKENTTVRTVQSEASCGYTFTDNMSYLVFANEDKDGNLQTGLCNGNRPLSGSTEEMKRLDAVQPSYEPAAKRTTSAAEAAPGAAITLQEEGNEEQTFWTGYEAAIMAGMIVVAVGIGVWLIRAGRNRR